jgi:hypothetical protein
MTTIMEEAISILGTRRLSPLVPELLLGQFSG